MHKQYFETERWYPIPPVLKTKDDRANEADILSYSLYGELKYGEESLSDERIQKIFSLLPELDTAVTAPSQKERWNAVNIGNHRHDTLFP